jgi:membrane-bound lytic murein transglycosylase D
MIHLSRLVLVFVFCLVLSTNVTSGEETTPLSTLKMELEDLHAQILQVQQQLEDWRGRLHRAQNMWGMDRYRFPEHVRLFEQPIPLYRRDVWERLDLEFLLSVYDVPQVLLWVKRANRYFPIIEAHLHEKGLPDDLKYVAIVESSLRPEAQSYAGAVGLWQFIAPTGRKYALRRTRWVDERRDPVSSTEAALNYLTVLHEMFGDWFLAVAAYNVGENQVKEELKKQRVTSYFDLSLPRETERYVFRIAAAKIILSDPEKYGFDLDPEELYEPFTVEKLQVRLKRRGLNLVSLARACDMTYREFKSVNPHFRRSSLPAGRYTFYLPTREREDALAFIEIWNKHAATGVSASGNGDNRLTHTVSLGESLWGIAKHYGVQVKAIRDCNRLESQVIHPGQKITICK